MERFPDGTHVWLRNRARRLYLHADEDGSGVSLSASRARLNAAWEVHLIARDGRTFLLLRCAAYGRYLSLTAGQKEDGHRGRQAAQCNYADPEQPNIRWTAIDAGDGSGDVRLCNTLLDAERYLRGNGVTVDGTSGYRSTMMQWTVQHIPPRAEPPPFPTTPDLVVHTALSQRRNVPMMDNMRQIRYMQKDEQGNHLSTVSFNFFGRSLFNLMNEVAMRVGEDMSAITLCVYAGFHGRLTPLVVDLPHNEERLDMIVLPTSSPAAMGLRHPNVDGPPTAAAMDMFPDRAYVRLRGENYTYLVALEDGVVASRSGSLFLRNSRRRDSLDPMNSAWAVHRVVREGSQLFLLQNCAYGKYLSLETIDNDKQKSGRSFRMSLVSYNDIKQNEILWIALWARGGDGKVVLKNQRRGASRILCAVESIPQRRFAQTICIDIVPPIYGVQRKFKHWIHYVKADESGNFLDSDWKEILFLGQSVFHLRQVLARELKERNPRDIILCIWSGILGRPVPLVARLPTNSSPIEIVVYITGSPATVGLKLPNADALGLAP